MKEEPFFIEFEFPENTQSINLVTFSCMTNQQLPEIKGRFLINCRENPSKVTLKSLPIIKVLM